MFPIRDHNPSQRTAYITYFLMAANILIFLSYAMAFDDQNRLGQIYYDWGMTPSAISDGSHYYTLFTHMFMHGGFMHLAGNMLFLWIFGDNMEDEMGHFGFLLFYIMAGLAAGLAQYYTEPYSNVPLVGASGAIAGVMGGYLLLFPRAKVDILFIFIIFFKIWPIPAWVMLGLWFGLQLLNGVAVSGSEGGVAYWAHAGGFIIGLLFALPLWFRLGGKDFWRVNHGAPPHPEAEYKLVRTSIPRVNRK